MATTELVSISLGATLGTASGIVARKEKDGRGILLLHAWWGLNAFFKETCLRLAESGYTVLAPDMFDGYVAKSIEEANAHLAQVDSTRATAVAVAGKEFLRELTGRESVTVIGFSLGADYSLRLASQFGSEIERVVLFYGVGECDYDKIKAKVMIHLGEADVYEDLEYCNGMMENFQKHGVDAVLHTYPNGKHWFVEIDRPEFDAELAEIAWSRTLNFLKTSPPHET